MPTALVTGPTSGIGRGFARRLASDGHDLVLVARDRTRLGELAAELERIGVRCEVMVADLGHRDQLDEVAARLADPDRPIEVLVNNAGFGVGQRFVGGDLAREQAMVDVMVTAMMRLSHAALPAMVRRGRGDLINVSSVAGFLPFGSYSAAKAWVTTFTQGIATELTGSGVRALAVCPGFVRTEFHDRARIDIDRSSDTWWLEVDAVVAAALRDLRRGKVISVPGAAYKGLVAGAHLLPRDVLRRTERFRRTRISPGNARRT
jgi:short-subunit dehydrogenase